MIKIKEITKMGRTKKTDSGTYVIDYKEDWEQMKNNGLNATSPVINEYKKTYHNVDTSSAAPISTMNEMGIRNLYPSLYAPDLANGQTDNMQGWRGTMSAINNKYGGDIIGYANTDAFKGLSQADRQQYYQDAQYFNSLYNTVNAYDTDIANEKKKQKEAEVYASQRQRLMQKYMPETLAAMGYANTGLAADALMGINNRYENYALSAKEQSEENQNSILNKYRKAAGDFQAGRANQELADMQAQDTNYNGFLNSIYTDPLSFNTAMLNNALQQGKITQAQYDELARIQEQERAKAEQEAQTATKEDLIFEIYNDVGNFNRSILDAALKMGRISETDYNELVALYDAELENYKGTVQEGEESGYYDQFKENIITSAETFNPEELSQAVKLGYLTEEQKNELLELYQDEYPEVFRKLKAGTNMMVLDHNGNYIGINATLADWSDWANTSGLTGGITAQQLFEYKDDILEGHSGKSGGKRDNELKSLVEQEIAGKLTDGAIYDINYGENDFSDRNIISYVVYYKGKFYPVKAVKQ
jgi:hypothetical protein